MYIKTKLYAHRIFDYNLVVIRKSKLAFKLNKPVYVGMCILKLGKVLTHKFYHDYMKNKYENKSKQLFTDTDSLMNETKTEDVYKDFSSHKEMFDVSNFSSKSKCYDESNKLVTGKIKDGTDRATIEEFVRLWRKMHSSLVDDNSEHKSQKA